MMIAVDEKNKRYVASECNKHQTLYCPGCQEPVILKIGKQKKAHFAHQNRRNCHGLSEGETSEHLELKKIFFYWCLKTVHDRPIQLESSLPSLLQRPDILCGRLAVEIQCSPITYKKMAERTKGYLTNGYSVWWVLGSSFLKKDHLTSREKYFYLYNETRKLHVWKLDWLTKKLWLFYCVKESIEGKMTCEKMSWSCGSESPIQLLANEQNSCTLKKVSSKTIGKKWLQKKLYYRQSKYLSLQKECYLRGKHLLYLSAWIYEDSQFFFYFQEKIFFYRLLFEEVMNEQMGRSKQWRYINWLQKIEPNKINWIFPMINKKMIYALFYKECEEIFFV